MGGRNIWVLAWWSLPEPLPFASLHGGLEVYDFMSMSMNKRKYIYTYTFLTSLQLANRKCIRVCSVHTWGSTCEGGVRAGLLTACNSTSLAADTWEIVTIRAALYCISRYKNLSVYMKNIVEHQLTQIIIIARC